jgi:penicillin-insensitive murein DD-endopeptidase
LRRLKIKETVLFFILTLFAAIAFAGEPAESVCYGTTGKGRIENAWQLPSSGENYQAYGQAGVLMGRNYLHSSVYAVMLDAYKELQAGWPQKKYVYGETGWKNGGRFRPHKTHQNGLSVDFFVPVIDDTGKSVMLPSNVLNKYGYDIEFSQDGIYRSYKIDFEAMAAHLLALKKSADRKGVKIKWVIFDNDLQKLLFQTSRGGELQSQLVFSKKKPWVRHDEHYHVDFVVPCKD